MCGQVLDAFDDFDGDSDSEKPTLKPSNLHERSPLPSSCVRYSGTPGLRGVLGYSRACAGFRVLKGCAGYWMRGAGHRKDCVSAGGCGS